MSSFTPPTGTPGQAPDGTSAGNAPSGSSSTSTGQPQGDGPGLGSSSSEALATALNQTTSQWSAAVIGDQSAASLILSSDTAVMSIGGWSGTDDNVTLEQFQQYVADGKITYFIASGQGDSPGGDSGSGASITQWVEDNFTSTTIDGTTVYVLTGQE